MASTVSVGTFRFGARGSSSSPPPPPPPLLLFLLPVSPVQGQAKSEGMVLVAYGPVRRMAALRDSMLCLPTDFHYTHTHTHTHRGYMWVPVSYGERLHYETMSITGVSRT